MHLSIRYRTSVDEMALWAMRLDPALRFIAKEGHCSRQAVQVRYCHGQKHIYQRQHAQTASP